MGLKQNRIASNGHQPKDDCQLDKPSQAVQLGARNEAGRNSVNLIEAEVGGAGGLQVETS
jgi:hypothetical protein